MITTHVLDTSIGKPATPVAVHLEFQDGSTWQRIGSGSTDSDGRCKTLTPSEQVIQPGTYRLIFETGNYFKFKKVATFYPRVTVLFEVTQPAEHHHVPLLLNPFGYSTYRGT